MNRHPGGVPHLPLHPFPKIPLSPYSPRLRLTSILPVHRSNQYTDDFAPQFLLFDLLAPQRPSQSSAPKVSPPSFASLGPLLGQVHDSCVSGRPTRNSRRGVNVFGPAGCTKCLNGLPLSFRRVCCHLIGQRGHVSIFHVSHSTFRKLSHPGRVWERLIGGEASTSVEWSI